MLHNNNFSRHTNDERTESTGLASANIDTYAVELDVTGAKLTRAQGLGAAWLTALATASVESGEKDEAFQEFHLALDASFKRYVELKDFLMAIIFEHQKPDDIINAYGFNDLAPNTYNKFLAAVEKWDINHTRLIAKIPPDVRVLPALLMADLLAKRDALALLYGAAMQENEESTLSFTAKFNLFNEDTRFLSWLFTLAKVIWGDDDPRLRLLGFCPSSEVWTSNKPHAPKQVVYDPITGTLSWEAVEDVDSYECSARITGTTGDWTTFYAGAATTTTEKPPTPDVWDVRCRAIAGENLGNWSTAIEVDLSQQ